MTRDELLAGIGRSTEALVAATIKVAEGIEPERSVEFRARGMHLSLMGSVAENMLALDADEATVEAALALSRRIVEGRIAAWKAAALALSDRVR